MPNSRRFCCFIWQERWLCSAELDIALVVGEVSNERITPHSEEFQGVIWHSSVTSVQTKPDHLGVYEQDAASNIWDRDGVVNEAIKLENGVKSPTTWVRLFFERKFLNSSNSW